MAKICSTCGRSSVRANLRSHSNIATIRRQRVNIQTRHLAGKTILLCTNCIKTKNKVKA